MWQETYDWLMASHRFAGFDWSYLTAFGFTGTIIFGGRFIVQWIESERAGRSVVPKLFWYLSIAGSLIMLVYFVLRRDPAGAFGFLPNSLVYLRNLQLIRRAERARAQQA